jgi:hypothetical protein
MLVIVCFPFLFVFAVSKYVQQKSAVEVGKLGYKNVAYKFDSIKLSRDHILEIIFSVIDLSLKETVCSARVILALNEGVFLEVQTGHSSLIYPCH